LTTWISFLAGVGDGSVKILASDWPAFLYPAGTVYEEDNIDLDLFRSSFLVNVSVCNLLWPKTHWYQAWKHIFRGNGVEESKLRGSTRPTVSDINKLDEVNGRTIAYAAVLVSEPGPMLYRSLT
jgi:hypothetical protein